MIVVVVVGSLGLSLVRVVTYLEGAGWASHRRRVVAKDVKGATTLVLADGVEGLAVSEVITKVTLALLGALPGHGHIRASGDILNFVRRATLVVHTTTKNQGGKTRWEKWEGESEAEKTKARGF